MTIQQIHFQPPASGSRIARLLMILGFVGLLLGFLWSWETTWSLFLLVSFGMVTLGLAGMLLIALQYICNAGWGVALRRIPEALCWLIPIGGAGVLLAILLCPQLYPWTSSDFESHSEFKSFWLSYPFFLCRAVIYLCVWWGLACLITWHSRRQDEDGKLSHTTANQRLSALFMVVYGVTCWLASYDWLMSREPHWFSTIFPVYNFAGMFTAGLAVMILVAIWLRRRGTFRNVLSKNHLHDLGKLLFGMSTFWAYIWYCQYMLIWYVNNPEETPYYIQRFDGIGVTLFWTNLVLNWLIPFVVLLSRPAKRSEKILINVCVILLLGRCLDLYLMIDPTETGVLMVLVLLVLILGGVGVFLEILLWAMKRVGMLPINDPYLVESLPAGQMPDDHEHASAQKASPSFGENVDSDKDYIVGARP